MTLLAGTLTAPPLSAVLYQPSSAPSRYLLAVRKRVPLLYFNWLMIKRAGTAEVRNHGATQQKALDTLKKTLYGAPENIRRAASQQEKHGNDRFPPS